MTDKYVFIEDIVQDYKSVPSHWKWEDKIGLHLIQGASMKIMTFHPLVIVVEDFFILATLVLAQQIIY
jgi:hypothetical protein